MLARSHHSQGWLYLKPADWRATLSRLIQERDLLDDPHHVGHPPAFLQWVDTVQMLALMRQDFYRRQAVERIAELQRKHRNLQVEIDNGRLDLRPAAGRLSREIKWLEGLLSEVPA